MTFFSRKPAEPFTLNPGMETVVLMNPAGYRLIGDKTLPMGLLSVASMLTDDFNVVLIDQRVQRDWKARLRRIMERRPLCVGVTAMTGKQIGDAVRLSRMAKEMFPGVKVVWGGIHASLLPEQTLMNDYVDAVVVGEGEESFRELVEAYSRGRDPAGLAGVSVIRNGECVIGPQREFIDLQKLPPTPYNLIDVERYVEHGPYGRTIRLFSSRGCPQRCAFCYNCVFNRRRWRAFKPERVLHEIKFFADNYDINHVFFIDDNYFVNLDRALEIANGIRFLPGKISWSVLGAHCSDVDRMDDAYLRAMELSRLKEFIIGVESGSEKIISMIRKNVKVDRLTAANRRLAQFSIVPTYSFMSGFPQETDEDLKQTVDLAFRLNEENALAGFGTVKPFIPYPGTELYETALEYGYRPPPTLEDWTNYTWSNYLNLEIPWVSPAKRKQLSDLYFCSVLMNPHHPFIGSRLYTWAVTLLMPGIRKRLKDMNFRRLWITRVMWFIQNRMI